MSTSKQKAIKNEPEFDNPFVYDVKLSLFDKIKLAFGAIFLLPIRAICIVIIFACAFVVSAIIMIGYDKKKIMEKPIVGWRRKLKFLLNGFGRALVFCFGFHKIKRIGKRSEDARVLVAAPHTTFLDAFVFLCLGLTYELPSIVSRSTNVDIPIVGYIFSVMQPILVTREDDTKKESTIDEVKRRADPRNKWPQVFIFPEGTTTNGSCLISYKQGSFIPGEPVQPILIKYKNRCDTITWSWIGISAVKVIVLTLSQFHNNMEIQYLKVYYPNSEEKENPKLYCQNVQKIMARHLDLPVRNFTFEDCRLMKKAKRLNLPLETGLIEFNLLKNQLDINYAGCQEILEKFAPFASKLDGRMRVQEFCDYLKFQQTPIVEQIFNVYDKHHNGSIEFKLFLIAHRLLYQTIKRDHIIDRAFKTFDSANKGTINFDDFKPFSTMTSRIDEIFKSIDLNEDGLIDLDEFKQFAKQKPEMILIFLVFNEMQSSKSPSSFNISIEKALEKSNANLEALCLVEPLATTAATTTDDDIAFGEDSEKKNGGLLLDNANFYDHLPHLNMENLAIKVEDLNEMTMSCSSSSTTSSLSKKHIIVDHIPNMNDSDSPLQTLLVERNYNEIVIDLPDHHHKHLDDDNDLTSSTEIILQNAKA